MLASANVRFMSDTDTSLTLKCLSFTTQKRWNKCG